MNGLRFPQDILVHIASFFETERGLITATGVCQPWRAALLSYPLLWRNAGGTSSEIEAYIERSKSNPLEVSLSDPSLVDLIVPHMPRLVSLTVLLKEASGIDISYFIERLCHPIPTLHTFRISPATATHHPTYGLEVSPDLNCPLFLHSKTLELNGLSFFFGPFSHITELVWHTTQFTSLGDFGGTLEGFPALERARITLYSGDLDENGNNFFWYTLPHLRELSLSMFSRGESTPQGGLLTGILGHLLLPRIEKLSVPLLPWPCESTNPEFLFHRFCPNFALLPELQVDLELCEITFRNPSGATLKCRTGDLRGPVDNLDWGDLPLFYVRRLTVNNIRRPGRLRFEDTWLSGLLGKIGSLEHVELEGECNDVIEWLCGQVVRFKIQTLTIRCGELDEHQAYWLKCLEDGTNLVTTVICIPGSTPNVRK